MKKIDMQATVQHVKADELSERIAKALQVDPDRRYTINIEIMEESQPIPVVSQSATEEAKIRLEDLPAFGMWADRDDIDPTQYARNLRKARYTHAG